MRSFLLFIFVFFCISGAANSYGHTLEAITDTLGIRTVAERTEKVKMYLSLSESYRYTNPDSSIHYADKVFEDKDENSLGTLAEALSHKSAALFYKGNYQQSVKTAEIGINSLYGLEEFNKLRADLIRIAGVSSGALGSYELSLRYFLEAQSIYESIGDQDSVNSILNNIGVTRLQLDDFDEALKIFLELDAQDEIDNNLELAIPVNLAFIYFELGELDKAGQEIERALNTLDEGDNRVAGLYFLIGQIAIEEARLDEAEQAFQYSIDIYERQGNTIEQVQPLIGLSRLYLKRNDISISWDYAQQALDIADKYNATPEKALAVEMLYLISKDRNQFSRALRYFELYKALSDSLQNDKVNEEVGRLTAAYEFSQKEQELMRKQADKELEAQAKISRQRMTLIIFFVVLVLAAGLIFFLYRNSSEKKKINELLSKKNDEINENSEKLKQSNDIKNRLFSILAHDLRGPLSSLQGMISLMEMNVNSKDEIEKLMPEVGEQFNSTSTLLNNLLQWSQSQMEGYRVLPEDFDLIELISQKKTLLNHSLKKKGVDFIYPEGEYFVYADRNMIDLVLQNLISNAIKYCQEGDKIEVSLSDNNGHGIVQIEDTGVGIPAGTIPLIFSEQFYTTDGTNSEKGTGLGLMLCKEFVERNNGTIRVESEVGEGSSFYFTIPRTADHP